MNYHCSLFAALCLLLTANISRHPAVLYAKEMTQKSEIEVVDLYLVDPATNAGHVITNPLKSVPKSKSILPVME